MSVLSALLVWHILAGSVVLGVICLSKTEPTTSIRYNPMLLKLDKAGPAGRRPVTRSVGTESEQT